MSEIIKVGMADLKLVKTPHSIRTSGLGSCVGIVIYDSSNGIAGMAHIMLPDSLNGKAVQNRAKYADTAIHDLITLLVDKGAKKRQLKAKMAGGAQMFTFAKANEMMRIGPRNVEAVRNILEKEQIQIVSEDVGGKSGRTIEFFPSTMVLNIRTVQKGTKDI
ncbi:chemotaxis protein CheD [Bacillus sp. TS-2]|nr:chemotaxis protein CheD [Bacillus sp. TS-2]